MKHLKAKLIACIALACALLVCLNLLYTDAHSAADGHDNATEVAGKLEGIGMSITSLLETNGNVARDVLRQRRSDVDLTVLSMRDAVTREGDAAIKNYESGCVIRKAPDGLVLPEDNDCIPPLEPRMMSHPPFQLAACEPFGDDFGGFWTCQTEASGDDEDAAFMLCLYRRISGAYYYAS
ncbi:MAG: hypothetical protein IKE17_13715 [Clostridia bacterium]|nr:hypothetical protein [Clostridia bacterium]